jgi:APA family basic amino acid/polyamine antiporter
MSQPQPQKLSFVMLIALVIGNMIGSGIYTLPAALAPFGSMAFVGWCFSAAGAIVLAIMFSNLSRTLVKTGGPYAYCRAGLGDFVGFLVAYNYWVAICVGNATVVVSLVGYLGVFFPLLNEHTVGYNPWFSFAIKVSFVWLTTLINCLGIRRAGEFQVFTVFLKVLPLLFIIIFGLHKIDFSVLVQAPLGENHISWIAAMTSAATLTLWAFVGLEAATIPAESAVDVRDIAKATLCGTLLAAVIYILSSIIIMSLIPIANLQNLSAPFSAAAQLLFGPQFAFIIGVSAIFSCLGSLNGWVLMQGQIPMAAARDGLFPVIFQKRNQDGTPIYGLIISSILVTLVLMLTVNQQLVKQFTFITLLATLGFLVPYFMTAMADLILLKKKQEKLNKKRFRRSIWIAILAGIYAFWMIIGAGRDIVFYGILLMLSSVPVYVLVLWQNKRAAMDTAREDMII